MINVFKRASGALRRYTRDASGTASIEFAILFPPIFLLFASGVEAGLMMTRNVMLERSVDIAGRELRLGMPQPPTFQEFREQICAEMLLDKGYDCLANVQVELQPVSSDTWSPLNPEARCINRAEDINPADSKIQQSEAFLEATNYETGANNDFMLVRVCMQVDPILPNYALGALLSDDGDNGYSLVVISAFVNEPSR